MVEARSHPTNKPQMRQEYTQELLIEASRVQWMREEDGMDWPISGHGVESRDDFVAAFARRDELVVSSRTVRPRLGDGYQLV